MTDLLKSIEARYPDIAKLRSIGRSLNDRHLWVRRPAPCSPLLAMAHLSLVGRLAQVMEISDNVGENEPGEPDVKVMHAACTHSLCSRGAEPECTPHLSHPTTNACLQYIGNMHGDETVGREILIRLIVHLTEEYYNNNTRYIHTLNASPHAYDHHTHTSSARVTLLVTQGDQSGEQHAHIHHAQHEPRRLRARHPR
jgi:hypothetical protein